MIKPSARAASHMPWLYRGGGAHIYMCVCMTHADSGLGAYKQLGACGGGPSRGKSADAREAPVGAHATGIQEFEESWDSGLIRKLESGRGLWHGRPHPRQRQRRRAAGVLDTDREARPQDSSILGAWRTSSPHTHGTTTARGRPPRAAQGLCVCAPMHLCGHGRASCAGAYIYARPSR